MMRILGVIGVAIVVVMAAQTAHAYTFTLTQRDPDLTANPLTVSYTVISGTGTLSVTGTAASLTPVGLPQTGITGGTYALNATINATTGALQSGTVTADGTFSAPGYNYTSGVLLTGNLTAMSYTNGLNIVYFDFTPTGGDALPIFGNSGGIILNLNASSPTLWAASFNNGPLHLGTADNFSSVPEPITGALTFMALGSLAFVGVRRGRGSYPAR
jgi:hypothetical protein